MKSAGASDAVSMDPAIICAEGFGHIQTAEALHANEYHQNVSNLTAVLSSYMLFQSKVLDGQDLVPALKRAAILCDKIFIDLQGLGEPGGQLENMFINSSFGGKAEHHDLTDDKQFKKLILRRHDLSKTERNEIPSGFDYGKDPVYAQALDFVRNLDDDFFLPIAKPWRGVDHKARGSVALQLAEDILMPAQLRSVFPEAVGLLSPLHKKMLSSIKLPFLDDDDPLVQLAVINAVDYGELTWREILDLRKSPFLTEFRLKLALIEKTGDANMQQELWADLWGFAAENKPSPGKAAVSGLLANLPIGPVNPFSIGFALADTAKADSLRRKFGWLYFVMEANPDLIPSPEGEGVDLSEG